MVFRHNLCYLDSMNPTRKSRTAKNALTFTSGHPHSQGGTVVPAITLPDGSQITLHGFDPIVGNRYTKRAKKELPTLDTRNEIGAIMVKAYNEAVKTPKPKMPSDEEIREAFENDAQQWFADCLTPDRGYATPIDNVKALVAKALAG